MDEPVLITHFSIDLISQAHQVKAVTYPVAEWFPSTRPEYRWNYKNKSTPSSNKTAHADFYFLSVPSGELLKGSLFSL